MESATISDLQNLYDWCDGLRGELQKARAGLSDAQWAVIEDSPFYDIIAAAMDVEAAIDRCDEV